MKKTTQKILLFLLVAFINQFAIGQMAGTFSINGGALASANNYQSVSAAVSDLMTGIRTDGGVPNGPGVNGPVVLRLAAGSGPYTEQVTFGTIAGASVTNTIRLTGGSSREAIQFGTVTYADKQIIKLDGSKHIHLDSLTINVQDTVFGMGIQLLQHADSNHITNCHVNLAQMTSQTALVGILIGDTTIFANGPGGSYNLIEGNWVQGAELGIQVSGISSSIRETNNYIANNIVENFRSRGITAENQDNDTIVGNQVIGKSNPMATAEGISTYYCYTLDISSNLVLNPGRYGFRVFNCNTTTSLGGPRCRISNNMIAGNFVSSAPKGIYFQNNCHRFDIWNNSISINSGNGECISIGIAYQDDIRNNALSYLNSTSAKALQTASSWQFGTVDYNDYWVPGSSNFINIGSAYSPATFVGGGGFNSNSLNVDPLFINPLNDLHISSGLSLYDKGTIVPVNVDIDGEPRPLAPSIAYDIGADEYTPNNLDAGAWMVTGPVAPVSAGTYPVQLVIRNYGQQLDSATIGWTIDGVPQTTYNWMGTLLSSSNSSPFVIGNITLAPGLSKEIKVWTTNPNGGVDGNTSNDTITYSICAALNGVYSIGGLGADFPDLVAAVASLECGGVLGPVTFNLVAGTGPFVGQVVIPAISGASVTSTIRINGGTSREEVSFAGSTTSNRPVIMLDGADHIILDSLTILNNSPNFNFGIQITNAADSNVIQNCVVNLVPSWVQSSHVGIAQCSTSITAPNDNGDHNLILNNEVNGGYYGIVVMGLGGGIGGHAFDNHVIGNRINNARYTGLYYAHQKRCQIIDNHAVNTEEPFNNSLGIYLEDCYGIEVSQNLVNGWKAYGMRLESLRGDTTSRAKVINNIVGGKWFQNTSLPYGMAVLGACQGLDLDHNSVSIDSVDGHAGWIFGGVDTRVRNNSFATYQATNGYALMVLYPSNVMALDYNNYYAPGSSKFVKIQTEYTPATYVGGGGFNLNSKDGDPLYYDRVNDLHSYGTQLGNSGSDTIGVATDFDGEIRPSVGTTFPDIGADEFDVDTLDLAITQIWNPQADICPTDFQPIEVILYNQGTNTLTNVPLTVEVTGAASGTFTFTYPGPLAFLQFDTVTVGVLNTHPGGTVQLKAFHNLVGDQDIADDTLYESVILRPSPNAPIVSNTSTCQNQPANLVVNAPGQQMHWYDVAMGGVSIGSGNNFFTPPVPASTNFYVEATDISPDTLFVTDPLPAGQSRYGNFFSVFTGPNTVVIDSFSMFNNIIGQSPYTFYYRTGTYVGFTGSAAGWSQVGPLNITQAFPQPAIFPTGRIVLEPNTEYAFYVSSAFGYARSAYNGGTYSNTDLTIVCGGNSEYNVFSGFNNNRSFAGVVHYHTEGCPSPRVPVAVTVIPNPVVSLSDTHICDQAILTPSISTTSNPSYLWNDGSTNSTLQVDSSGTYIVQVTAAGCTTADTAIVVDDGLATLDLGPDTSYCSNTLTMLDAGSFPGASFLWNTGATTQIIPVTMAGQYSVTATRGNCSATDAIQIGSIPTPSANLAQMSFCPGETLLLDPGNVQGAQYQWASGQTTQTISITTPGVYTVTVTGLNGCRTIASAYMAHYPVWSGQIQVNYQACPTLTFNLSPVSTAQSWDWDFGDGSTGTGASPSHTYAQNGNYTVIATVNDQCDTTDVNTQFSLNCIIVGNEVGLSPGLQLFPNPSNGLFQLKITLDDAEQIEVEVINLLGSVLKKEAHKLVSGDHSLPINLDQLPAGTYLIRVRGDEWQWQEKAIKLQMD